MENELSLSRLWVGVTSRLASNGLQCSLLALLAFLPLAGLALLTPEQIQSEGETEFLLAALFICRLLTPPVAILIAAYLARKDKMLSEDQSLGTIFRRLAFPSIGAVLAVATFGAVASLFFILPGVAFWLASCVVLPVLVCEGTRGPEAIKKSWELTREHRVVLFPFWASYFVLSTVILTAVYRLTNSAQDESLAHLPWVQQDFFLPMVFVVALLYSGLVVASHEVYSRLREFV